jgi:rubredoxin
MPRGAPQAHEACYEMSCEGTPLQGSRLLVEDVPVVIFCPICRAERSLGSIQLFCCPECGTPTSEVTQGKELEVVANEGSYVTSAIGRVIGVCLIDNDQQTILVECHTGDQRRPFPTHARLRSENRQ